VGSIPLKPERLLELAAYAKRHDQDAARALAEFFAWEKRDHAETAQGICEGYEDFKAGRMQDSKDVFVELRARHGLSRYANHTGKARF